jgi:hypothetical protein
MASDASKHKGGPMDAGVVKKLDTVCCMQSSLVYQNMLQPTSRESIEVCASHLQYLFLPLLTRATYLSGTPSTVFAL